jgi:circadian clock protein KaiB
MAARSSVARSRPSPEYELKLYTTGASARSMRAVSNVVTFLSRRLEGRYRLQVVDLYERPDAAARAQVVAAPTLIKLLPKPVRRIIGDMSDEPRIMAALDLPEPGKPEER